MTFRIISIVASKEFSLFCHSYVILKVVLQLDISRHLTKPKLLKIFSQGQKKAVRAGEAFS